MLERKNYKTSLLIIIVLLASCSNGKIEYRKSSNGCITFPEIHQRMYTDTSTTMESDKLIDSKIEALLQKKEMLQEGSHQVYLINTSHSDIFSFTVKSETKDAFPISKTEIYKLSPGEEILLGCDTYITDGGDMVNQEFSIVGQRKN